MKSLPLIALLFVASPAFGQSRVYSNADLGSHLSSRAATSPAAALETWLTHTGGVPPPPPAVIGRWVGPTSVIVSSSTGARMIPWEETYAGRQAIQAEQDLRIARLNARRVGSHATSSRR